MKHFFFVRHGSTKLNGLSQIRGWRDVPLDETGKKDATRLAKLFKNIPVDVIVSSDLIRAKETANTIAKAKGMKISEVSKEFRPWDVGKLTATDSNKAGPLLQRFIEEQPDKKLPDGESFNSFKNRYLAGLSRILNKYKGKNLMLVAHHRNDRLLAAWIKSGQKDDIDASEMAKEGIPAGGVKVYSQ